MTTATQEQISSLATFIADQAEAIAEARTSASVHAAARLMLDNVVTLVAWTSVSPWTSGPPVVDPSPRPIAGIDTDPGEEYRDRAEEAYNGNPENFV